MRIRAAVFTAILFVLAGAHPLSAQAADRMPGQRVMPGGEIPSGYHVHWHGDHGHLHHDVSPPDAEQQNQARRRLLEALILGYQSQIAGQRRSYRNCVYNREPGSLALPCETLLEGIELRQALLDRYLQQYRALSGH